MRLPLRFLSALSVLSVLSVLSTAPAAAQSVAGEWEASMDSPGGVLSYKIIMVVDGQKLTGTVKRSSGDSPLTGTVVGDTLRFSYPIVYNGNPMVLAVVALASGGNLKGTISFGEAGEADWWATRVPPATRPPLRSRR